MRVPEQKVKRMEALYLAKAQSLANATGMPIQVWRSGLDDPTTAGFRVRVGGTYSLVARVLENRWEVATHTRKGTASSCYPTDQAFEDAQGQLLEPIVADALRALLRREAALGAVPASSDRRVTAPLGRVVWEKLQYVLGRPFAVSRRRAKKASQGVVAEPAAPSTVERATADDEAAIRERLQYIRDLTGRPKH